MTLSRRSHDAYSICEAFYDDENRKKRVDGMFRRGLNLYLCAVIEAESCSMSHSLLIM